MKHRYKLTSRKLWVAIAEILLLIINAYLDHPLNETELHGTILAALAYIGGESLSDMSRYKNGGK